MSQTAESDDPNCFQEKGDQAFEQKNFKEAVKQYTLAIDASKQKPNHIYVEKRAFAYLLMGLFSECIADCNQAMLIDPVYPKSYFTKARAQIQGKQEFTEALDTLKKGLEKNPGNIEMQDVMKMV